MLWPTLPSKDLFCEELRLFADWFSRPVATHAARLSVKTKRGNRWKGKPKMVREGARSHVAVHEAQAVLGTEWKKVRPNLEKPVVINGLLAAFELKRFLVLELGPGATSLGTTGVERSFWQHTIHNKNKTGVWACNASRQYKAVVGWKREVRVALRGLVDRVGHDTTSGREARAIMEACADFAAQLEGGVRKSLLLTSSRVDQPSDNMINVGLDEFRLHQNQQLDE